MDAVDYAHCICLVHIMLGVTKTKTYKRVEDQWQNLLEKIK